MVHTVIIARICFLVIKTWMLNQLDLWLHCNYSASPNTFGLSSYAALTVFGQGNRNSPDGFDLGYADLAGILVSKAGAVNTTACVGCLINGLKNHIKCIFNTNRWVACYKAFTIMAQL
jgi:hypothetical protein